MQNRKPPQPHSPKSLDEKILSYAKHNAPQHRSAPSWYGLFAGSCALVLAAALLPSLAPQFHYQLEPQRQAPAAKPTSAKVSEPIASQAQGTASTANEAPASAILVNKILNQESIHSSSVTKKNHKSAVKIEKLKAAKRTPPPQTYRDNELFSDVISDSELVQSPVSKPKSIIDIDKRLSPSSSSATNQNTKTISTENLKNPENINKAAKISEKLNYLEQLQKKHAKQAEQEYQLFRTECNCELPQDLDQALQTNFSGNTF